MDTKNVNLNIRTTKELKDEVGSILHDLGLNHSIVINMLYHQIALLKGLPFSIKIPNKITQLALDELESGEPRKTYRNTADLFEDLEI